MKLSRRRAPAYAIQCHQLEMLSANMTREESPEIQDLPMKMPPNTEIERRTEVKTESNPINIKPYRYPHLQKAVIERLIQDLLKCVTLIILEYLIKWKDLPEEDAFWENESFFNNIRRCLCFEDKAFFREEGNVM